MSCRDCKHVNTVGFEEPYGVCRRYPPRALDQVSSCFPVVELDKFNCGEFAAVKRPALPAPSKLSKKEKK